MQFTEGQTRRSKRTGEVQTFQGGAWVTTAPGEVAPVAVAAPTAYVIPPDPARVAEEQEERSRRAEADARVAAAAQRADAAAAREAVRFEERDDPKPPAGYRVAVSGALEAIPGGPADKAAVAATAKPTEYQSKSAGFLARMMRANNAYGAVPDDERAPRSAVGQWVNETLPNVGNYLNSDQRQVADQTARDFIAATLRQESGAAISETEFDNQYRIYFPMPGDAADVLKEKALARQQAIKGFRVAAGPLADQAEGSVVAGGPIGTDKNKRLQEMFNAGASREELMAFMMASGVKPTDPAQVDKALADRDQSGRGAVFTNPAVQDRATALKASIDKQEGAAGAGELLLHGGTLGLSDEAAGVGNALYNAVSSPFTDAAFDPVGSYQAGNRAQDMRLEDARRTSGVGGTIAEIGGGLASGNPTNALAGMATLGSRAAAGARAGAFGGALAGFGTGEGATDSLSRSAGGAALGGVFGAILPAAAGLLTRRTAAGAPELLEAATRQGVDLLPAQTGGAVTKALTGGAAQLPIAQRSISRATERLAGQSAKARDRAASGMGKVLDTEGAGEVASAGAGKTRDMLRARGSSLYDRAEALSRGVSPKPIETQEVVARNLAELSNVPGGSPEAPIFAKLQEGLTEGKFSVADLRKMRTALNQQYFENGLRTTDASRRISQVVEAAERDIERALVSTGRAGAVDAFRAANSFHRQRVEVIDQAMSPIIGKDGKKAGEEVVSALERASQGNGRRFQRFIAALPPEERGSVQATLISRMGSAAPNAPEGEAAFSLERFLTSWNKMTPRARSAVATGESRQALDDLAKIAKANREANRYTNTSRTAGAAQAGSLITLGGGVATTGMSLIPEVVAGKLLANPGFARWLARAPASPAAMQAHVQRLSVIAARVPALQSDLLGLQSRLTGSLAETGGRVVAEENPRN